MCKLLKTQPISIVILVSLVICQQLITKCVQAQVEDAASAAAAANAKKKLPKDPLYITDLDLEHLYDQWEESDEVKLPPDELPPHQRPGKPLMPTADDAELFKDPEKLMRASKKGKTVMAFVTVDGKPTREETEELTQRWQVGLTNNHMKCQRFVIDDHRAIFVFEDGSQAFEAKDYMVEQEELKEFSIDNRVWHGRASLSRREEL